MTHGVSGSCDMFCTLPPTAKARPDGVSRGWDGAGALVACDNGGPRNCFVGEGNVEGCVVVCEKEEGGQTKRGDEIMRVVIIEERRKERKGVEYSLERN